MRFESLMMMSSKIKIYIYLKINIKLFFIPICYVYREDARET